MMAKRAALLRFSGVVDRPKKLMIIDSADQIKSLNVLFMRVYVVAQRRHHRMTTFSDTIGLVVSPALFKTAEVIRYSNDIFLQGQLREVKVLHHLHDRRQIAHLIKAGWAKLQQVQAVWQAKYLIGQPNTQAMVQRLERLTTQWSPQLNNLAAYQYRVRRVVRLASAAAQQALREVQMRQRQIDAETRAAVDAVTTKLLVIESPSKPLTIAPYGRLQRKREAIDQSKLADPAYLHQQAQEIMLDYQFAQTHHLPLASRNSPWDEAELAQWQQWVDATF